MFIQDTHSQAQDLRQLWNQYGKWLAAAIILALLGSFGWQSWRNYQQQQQAEASEHYQVLMEKINAHQPDADPLAQTIMDNYRSTPYAGLAGLLLAKNELQKQNNPKVIETLTWVKKRAKDKAVRQIAAIRLARILMSQQRYNEALEAINKTISPAFTSRVEELKGDIYRQQHQIEQAKQAYQLALNSMQQSKINHPLLAMKASELNIQIPSTETNNP